MIESTESMPGNSALAEEEEVQTTTTEERALGGAIALGIMVGSLLIGLMVRGCMRIFPLGCRERASNFDKLHRICWVFMGLLATILQTMYQPFETNYPKVVAFIATITIYFLSLLAKLVLQTYGINLVTVNKLSPFLGVLAVSLLLLIIVPAIGWLALGMWGCVFGIVVRYSYFQIKNDFVNTVEEIRRVMNTWRNGNANEQQINGMPVEFLPTVEEIRIWVMDTLRNGNANEQQVNGMQDKLLEAVEEITRAMNTLRNGNANEQQAVEEIRRAMNTLRNGNANEQQVNGMPDENQHQHHELSL